MIKKYNKFLIGLTEQFDPARYTSIVDEVRIIREKTDAFPPHHKTEMIISFLKDHTLPNHWADANPELTQLVTSQTLFTGSIESLFESCRNNPDFRQGLEDYLKERLAGNVHP